MFNILDISSSAMSAQSKRLNIIASNLANADAVSTSAEGSYKSRHAFFQTQANGGVEATAVVESNAPAKMIYDPSNPLADEKGYIYGSNVNPADEMVDMISASRSYQTQVEVINQTKKLIEATIRLGEK